LAASRPGPTLPPPPGKPTAGSCWSSTKMMVHVSRDAGRRGVQGDGKPLRFCQECRWSACAHPRSALLAAFFPSPVQLLPVVVPRTSATLVVCRRDQQRTRDQLRPFPAQTETACRTGKQATEHIAPCSRKHRLEEEAITALKAVAREHSARWTCSPFEGDQAVGLTLLPLLQAHQGRSSQLTVAPLHGQKEKSLLLCWTESSVWSATLLAVHAASEHEGGGDGSFHRRHHTQLPLFEVVRCSPQRDG
jgi:hypothetical protein